MLTGGGGLGIIIVLLVVGGLGGGLTVGIIGRMFGSGTSIRFSLHIGHVIDLAHHIPMHFLQNRCAHGRTYGFLMISQHTGHSFFIHAIYV